MRILFVCTGNVFRSVSAQYCLQRFLAKSGRKDITVSSAGILASPEPVHPSTRKALAEYGIDVSGHVQRRLTKELLDGADLVVAMAQNHVDFIKSRFGEDAILFNEIAKGERTSVLDVDDVIPDYFDHPKQMADHIEWTVRYIHDAIPQFMDRLNRFIKS